MTMLRTRAMSRRVRGAVLVSTIFAVLIASILLLGVSQYVVSHYQRADADANYARALDLAEAGVNYEFARLSAGAGYADQSPGTTYQFGTGSFTVRCVARNDDGTESSPWAPPAKLYVYSTGRAGAVSRTIKVAVKAFPVEGDYAIYTMESTSVWNGSSLSINGDIGTNGEFRFNGTPGISGTVYFNGPNAGWYGGVAPGSYPTDRTSNPVEYKTVAQVAADYGGLTYLSTHNSNASANPPIVNNSITSSVTLTGPGDYYIENLQLTGQNKITFDNSLGPVRIWVGPEGGSNVGVFRGGSAAISPQPEYDPNDPSQVDRRCTIYVATKGGLNLAGNEVMDASVYAYNKDSTGKAYGYVLNSGNPTLNGQILAYQADINGNLTVNYRKTLIPAVSVGYYGFDNLWLEIHPK